MNAGMHIAVFAKAPVAGSVKTRLIPLLGKQGAADVHRAMILRTLDTACCVAPRAVSLWTAGAGRHPFFVECADRHDLDLHAQCEGDLGQRMADCLRRLLKSHSAVLLIGTDCPAFGAADLHAAARSLQQGRRMVFIPAEDGGYVLVGANGKVDPAARESMLVQVFQEIDWSTPRVMMQTRRRMSALGWESREDWQELPVLWDVDTPDDYARALREGLLPA